MSLIRHDVDPGILNRLEGAWSSDHLPRTSQRALQGRIRRAIARTRDADVPSPQEATVLEELHRCVEARQLQHVRPRATPFSHPVEEHLLEVWADELSEHEDPRGEFVLLQLHKERGTLKRAGSRRMKELEAAHRDAWLQCFGPSLKRSACRFRFGMAEHLAVTHERLMPCAELGAVASVLLTQQSHEALLTEGLKPRRVMGVRTLAGLHAALSLGVLELGTSSSFHELGFGAPDGPLPDAVDLDLLDVQGVFVARHLRSVFKGHVTTLILRTREEWAEEMHRELEAWRVEDGRVIVK